MEEQELGEAAGSCSLNVSLCDDECQEINDVGACGIADAKQKEEDVLHWQCSMSFAISLSFRLRD